MKTAPAKPPGYESKPADYFEQSRPEMLRFVPPNCKRVLDVGCGKGGFGELLKNTWDIEVWGIEPVTIAAAEAATKLDHVIDGMFTPETVLPQGSFDAIFFNDVLEHFFDPAAALCLARTLLKPDGVVIASLPNIRHFPTQWEIVIKGEWRYRDSGILDRTHLRFFTKKSILAFFADCDFKVEKIAGINRYCGGTARKWRFFRIINLLTFTAIEDMKYMQFTVLARPMESSRES